MNPIETRSNTSHILYDADLIGQADESLFAPGAWRERRGLLGLARGHGGTAFVTDGRREFVLRHYYRGGVPARFVADRYLWTGLRRTRAWHEWHLTAGLYLRGLPVPRPAAARVRRRGIAYTADLLTLRVPGSRSLAEALKRDPLRREEWEEIGSCLRRFHDAGLDHADLNAHNILVSPEGPYLIDFDRGRLRKSGRWEARRLARLRRSLDKLKRRPIDIAFQEDDWRALLLGYRRESPRPVPTPHAADTLSY